MSQLGVNRRSPRPWKWLSTFHRVMLFWLYFHPMAFGPQEKEVVGAGLEQGDQRQPWVASPPPWLGENCLDPIIRSQSSAPWSLPPSGWEVIANLQPLFPERGFFTSFCLSCTCCLLQAQGHLEIFRQSVVIRQQPHGLAGKGGFGLV